MSEQWPHWAVEVSWRVGRKVGRTIYAKVSDDPSDSDVLIGVMDFPDLAVAAVEAHNKALGNDGEGQGKTRGN